MGKIIGEEFSGQSCYDLDDEDPVTEFHRKLKSWRLVEDANRRDMLKLLNSPEAKAYLEAFKAGRKDAGTD